MQRISQRTFFFYPLNFFKKQSCNLSNPLFPHPFFSEIFEIGRNAKMRLPSTYMGEPLAKVDAEAVDFEPDAERKPCKAP
jgi:hypothetical protein